MTIVYPLRLKFHRNNMRHTVYTVEMFQNERDLEYSVKACVAENREQALEHTIAAVKSEAIDFLMNNHSTLKYEDFELIYSAEEIENGRVWTGGGTSSYVRIK